MLIALCINATWVLGLSGLLATLSFAHWQKAVAKTTWRTTLEKLALQRALAGSLLLFCLGQLLAASVLDARTAWIRVAIWAIFVLIFAGQLVLAKQPMHAQ
ncbi:MAG: hypothetical protein R2911_03490 [Caldilineaceae bacterium]